METQIINDRDLSKRTHNCGELSENNNGNTVTLIGWVNSLRDHGSLCFIDLRDMKGTTQIVVDAEDFKEILHKIKQESVIEISGIVNLRPTETINEKVRTGKIEVLAKNIVLHNACQVLPFPLDDRAEKVSEDLRLAYRYLDLRRKPSQDRLRLRSRVSQTVRNYLIDNDFCEVETPTLFKSTPEGAREFLVPSRLNQGQCYALTQSPQQYKQILMVAGFEKYFSLARCFRDEDLRADRQPEFTQIDLEMSFIDREDIYSLIEGLFVKLWNDCLNITLPHPFKRMTFNEAMNRFGSDKPDTRFDFEIKDATDIFKNSSLQVFAKQANNGGVIKALKIPNLADLTAGEWTTLENLAKHLGAAGLAFIKVKNGEWKSPLTKFLSDNEKAQLTNLLNIEESDLIMFMADSWLKSCNILGRIRLEAANLLEKKGLIKIDKNQYNFLWVVDFPLISYDEYQKRYVATHHPFTSPVNNDIHLVKSDPCSVRGQHYDIVMNGVELGGGSIRIHSPELQRSIFEDVLKIDKEVVENRFGYLLKALTFGAPPHGGIALGLDRIVALMSGTNSIRDVIAFPKTQKGQDLMSNSPGEVSQTQLKDLGLQYLPTLK